MGAILGAARKVRDKLLELGSTLLEEPVESLELAEGCVRRRDRHESRKTLSELAFVAYRDLLSLPPGMEPRPGGPVLLPAGHRQRARREAPG